eukprot:TRINITY_DN12961_c0_g1_i6.p1 TRINITY_DN12961_c0_g1~~TRINITY_DN12961_c0_g1_i6.p1  ORF type:complete len:106 (-),score=5.08 TRINITY_DN12961_c0_g1_i6:31-348(-)
MSSNAGLAKSSARQSFFMLKGLRLEGAEIVNEKVVLSNKLESTLKVVYLRWIKNVEGVENEDSFKLPVYLNNDRRELLFSVSLRGMPPEEKDRFAQRGVCMVAAL